MWPTMDGIRVVKDQEAGLVRRAVGLVLDPLIAEYRDDAEPRRYGVDWFDQWDCEQRLWLLEQVTVALYTREQPPPPAAMWEATIDVVFLEVTDRIESEIDESSWLAGEPSWRQDVIDAFRSQQGRLPSVQVEQTDIAPWRILVTQVADAILGISSYQRAESFRDGDIERSRRFLAQRGLPADFLQRIPPLLTDDRADRAIDRIRSIVAR